MILLGLGYSTGAAEQSPGSCGVQERWQLQGGSSSAPQTLQGSALKKMQGRISPGKDKLFLPRADEKRCYNVTCLW